MEIIIIILFSLSICVIKSQEDFYALNSIEAYNLVDIDKKHVNNGQSIILTCDLPNSMPDGKVLFVKYETKPSVSQTEIREDTDDERYEISQQYAWEWSLKINSISEEDSGIYVCKVGDVLIKKFELIVRVPPRIRDDPSHYQKIYKEGSTIEFHCPTTGTPKPTVTWYALQSNNYKEIKLQNSNTFRIENVTRDTPRSYQCRASNNIPPSDTKNLTFSIEFPPEIQIQAKYDRIENRVNLNCTIKAHPLNNKKFWRKDGNILEENDKFEITTLRLNSNTLVSKLDIKNYHNDKDNGLYECYAENNLKVAKMVYNLNKEFLIEMIPIGSSTTLRNKTSKIKSKKNKFNLTMKNKHLSSVDSTSINNVNKKIIGYEDKSSSSPYIVVLPSDTDKLIERRVMETTANQLNKSNRLSINMVLFIYSFIVLIR